MITRRKSMYLIGASALGLSTAFKTRAADHPLPQSADWADPMFAEPFIDIDEWRDTPMRYRYVHGGFKGTDALFSMYFPPKEQYQGRFFQPISAIAGNDKAALQQVTRTTPEITNENTTIGFAFASGGYLVESNLGSRTMYPLDDHTIEGYRTSAAVAKYSRVVAAQMYGPGRIYGYAYGGSGGGYKTVSMAENTRGIWDGIVPYVLPSPMATDIYPIQALAVRVLRDKFPAIVDAIDPGGSSDMYAGLSKEQQDVLREATRFGIPLKTWFMYERLGYGPLGVLIDYWVDWDPTYVEAFWKPGSPWIANAPEALKRERVQQKTTITKIIMSDEARKMGIPVPMAAVGANVVPAAFQLAEMPKGELKGASLTFKSGAAAGARISISSTVGDLAALAIGQAAYKYIGGMKVGDTVMVNNSIYLAFHLYHRFQVPPLDQHFYAFDQFRGPGGKPIYPQRPVLLGPKNAEEGCGSHQTGVFGCKMIVIETLMDEHAVPWNGDWYCWKVQQTLGSKIDDSFRIWMIDHAMHGALPYTKSDSTRVAGYLGALQQALRDVSAWAEKGTPPPATTNYKVVDSQIVVAPKAADRKSIQPVVTLAANGGVRADVKIGESVKFSGVVEVPPGTGKVAIAEWDFEGTGDYPVAGEIKPSDSSGSHATVTTTHSFSKPGTYFPVLRAGSQRNPDGTPYARVMNLARVRVVVT